MRATRLLVAGALVVGALPSGCAKRAPESAPATEAPHSAAPGPGEATSELAAVSAALAQNAASLAALGVDTSRSRTKERRRVARSTGKREEARDVSDDTSTGSAPDRDDAAPSKTAPTKTPAPGSSAKPKASAQAEPSAEPIGAASDDASGACDRICALAGVACDLAQRICTLADQHQGDARYEDVCWNADRQCEQASDACADCSAC